MNSFVFWITGLSGAGKTTLGKILYRYYKSGYKNTVFLDGDNLREVLKREQEHSLNDRKALAMSYARLCKLLVDQDINVICSTVSMFQEVRDWNRKNIKNYYEIYLKVSMEELVRRDQKKLYSKALAGEIKDVMGVDLPMEEPLNPDLVVVNNGEKEPLVIVDKIIACITKKENLHDKSNRW